MVFKALNDLALEYLSDLLIRNYNSHLRPLRNTITDLQLPWKAAKNGQRCFSHRGATLWNALPREIKQASSLQAFKVKLNYGVHILTSFFYSFESYFCVTVLTFFNYYIVF